MASCCKTNKKLDKSREITIVAIGDELSKKRELLFKYTCNKQFYRYHMPNTFNNTVREIIVDYIPYTVHFIDAECDDDYEILRWNAYEKADVILLCYAIGQRSTFENALHKWCAEIRKSRPHIPIVLVATDTEARGQRDRHARCVSTQEGENLKFAINACVFVECSVEKLVGIDDVFIEAVRSTYCNMRDYMSFYHAH